MNDLKLIFCFLTVALGLPLSAQPAPEVGLFGQGGRESLAWSIAGNLNGNTPNILSELKWKNLHHLGYELHLTIPVFKKIDGIVHCAQGFIVHGEVTDADYRQDDRQERVFYAREDAGKGQLLDFGGGFLIRLVDNELFRISLGTGYSSQYQLLYLINPKTGLNSSYHMRWTGPFLTGKLRFPISKKATLAYQTTYDQIRYHARGNWNLIDEFQHPVSFRHRAKGFVLRNTASVQLNLCNRLTLVAGGTLVYRTTGKGIDILYRTDEPDVKTQLNDVSGMRIALFSGVVWHWPVSGHKWSQK